MSQVRTMSLAHVDKNLNHTKASIECGWLKFTLPQTEKFFRRRSI